MHTVRPWHAIQPFPKDTGVKYGGQSSKFKVTGQARLVCTQTPPSRIHDPFVVLAPDFGK